MTTIDNPEIMDWFNNQNMRDDDLAACTLIATALAAIQMAIYYSLWDDQIDKRDDMIDREEMIRDDLHRRDIDVDIPRLKLKQDILGVPVPSPDLCGDALRCATDSMNDGHGVDRKADHMADQSCHGVPDNWCTHEGALLGARAAGYAGGMLGNAGKRREEEFRRLKTSLVLKAQRSARLDIGPALQNLGQASAIHAGKADIFLQGFNSAGASLGALVGRLANSQGTGAATNPGLGGGSFSSTGGTAGVI